MKPRNLLQRATAIISLLACHSAQAASGTWNVDDNGLWSLNTNWLSNTIADASGFTANFNNNITADRTVSLDSDRTLTSLIFGDSDTSTAGSWILNNNGTATNNLILAGTTPTITVNALGSTKTATISAIIEGTAGLTKAGAGTLAITGANTYTGTTTIQSGTLQIGNGGGSLNGTAGTALTFAGTGTFNVKEAASSTQGMGQLTFSAGEGTVTNTFAATAATLTFSGMDARTTGATANFTISGGVATTNKIKLTSTANAPLASSGSNNPGILFNSIGYARYDTSLGYFKATVYGTDTNAPANIGATNTTFAAAIGLATTSATDVSITAAITAQNTASINTLKMTQVVTQTSGSVLSVNGILLGGNTGRNIGTTGVTSYIQPTTSGGELVLVAGGTSGTLQIGSIIQNNGSAASALTKGGLAPVTLQSANTFSGDTTINAGVLRLGHNQALQNSGLDTSSSGTVELLTLVTAPTLGGLKGSKNLVSAITSNYNLVTALTLNPGTSVTHTYSGVISNGASNMTLTKTGAGTQSLTGTNTYTGATNVTAGTLAITGSGSINASSGVTVATGANFVYNSSTTLTKSLSLSGASSSSRAILGGSGTIGATVSLDNIGDTLSPGNSPGIQTFTSAQTWSSFSYDWEVNNFTGTTAGTDFDQLGLNTLNLTGGSASYILNILSLTSSNVAGNVPNFSEVNRSWTILTSNGGITGFNAANWLINSAGFADNETGSWALAQSGNDLVLSYAVVPEPDVAALIGGLGMLVLLRRRR